MMFLPSIGLLLGIILGFIFGTAVPTIVAKYLSVIAIASLDTLLEGSKSLLDNKMNSVYLLYSFAATAFLSCALVFFGDRVGFDIYLVAIVALGIRIYQNVNKIIMLWLNRRNDRNFINTNNSED